MAETAASASEQTATAAAEPASSSSADPESTGTMLMSVEVSRKRKAFACPPAAGDLGYAQFWWYRDQSGEDQGPFDSITMRGWFVGGHLPADTPFAASYYGEVPHDMWAVAELWENAQVRPCRHPPTTSIDLTSCNSSICLHVHFIGGGFCCGPRRGVCAADRDATRLH